MKFKVLGLLGVVMSLLCTVFIPALAQHFPFYVLDGWGGVHAGGGASTISPRAPYFGWDIARAIQYVPVGHSSTIYGEGYIVLDGYGGIHKGGQLASVSVAATPYFGWDIARDITMRLIPPRAAYGYFNHDFASFTHTTYTPLFYGVEFNLPDDGFVTLMGSIVLRNLSSTNFTIWNFGFGVDTTSDVISGVEGYQDVYQGTYTVNLSQTIFLGAGLHTFYLIAKNSATGTPQYGDATLTIIYIDQHGSGYSATSKIEE